MTDTNDPLDVMTCVTEIVAAYLSNNKMNAEDVPGFMQLVQRSLSSLGSSQSFKLLAPSEPVVAIKDSIQPDYLICLEDGRKVKMLKRHLKTAYNLTPDQYRERWNLPSTYPMVAPNYAKHRSHLAKGFGLGKQQKTRKKAA